MSSANSAAVWTDFVPEAIHYQVAMKLLVLGLLTGRICFVYLFLHHNIFYLISSVQVVCHFNILLTEAGVMHEAEYVYSIWST